jgi:hypothetical protein
MVRLKAAALTSGHNAGYHQSAVNRSCCMAREKERCMRNWIWKFYDAAVVMVLALFGAGIVFTLTAAVLHQ